jgi:hypothetical protein
MDKKLEIIQFPRFFDERGNLSFLEEGNQIPFVIERCFWVYDVPGGEFRGGHAYKSQEEIIIALSGSFDVVITSHDGSIKKFQLNRSYYGLYIPPLIWRHIENYSTNSLSLHVTSSKFDEDDYIKEFNDYKRNF